MQSVSVRCSNGQCGQQLGAVGPSIRSGNPKPVWRIRPGWIFKAGVLEHVDETFSSEHRLFHEITGGRRPEGVNVLRECDLPLCVRCPRCHRLRYVAPEVIYAGSPG